MARLRRTPFVFLPLLLALLLLRSAVGCGNSGSAGKETKHDAANSETSSPSGMDSGVPIDAAVPTTDTGMLPTDGATPGDSGVASGWTTFPGLPGTDGGYLQAIYVDSVSGSDSNTGATPAQALQHVSKTSKLYELLSAATSTSEIVVLLKPGSSWPAEQMTVPTGGTAAFPLLISGTQWPNAGQTARPTIGGGIVAQGGSHMAFEGLAVGPYTGTSTTSLGVYINIAGGTDYLIEDCLITHFYNLIQVLGSDSQPLTNLRVRRSYFFGAYGSNSISGQDAVVGFDGNDIVGALFEDNFFDYNGGPDGNYTNTSLTAPYSNEYAHDVYFADDGTRVVAFGVTFQHNLFARTLQSMKGPYTGLVDDNLFYNYSSGGYVGSSGVEFSNNVLVNGGGFSISLDNGHDPNTDAGAKTIYCTNLEYNEASPYQAGALSTQTLGSSIVGVNLDCVGNVIDGFEQAFDLDDQACLGYTFTNNIIQANKFFEFDGTWPQAACPLRASGNTYHSTVGPDAGNGNAFALEVHPSSGTTKYGGFFTLETFLKEDGGTYESQPFAFSDPRRNISSYLASTGLGGASSTLIDYLSLVRTQAATAHQWNTALSVAAVDAYLRSGHSMSGHPFTYGSACP
jgi:hypothetical protein